MATTNTGAIITQTAAPTNKAVAATGGSAIGAAVSTLVLYALQRGDTKFPPEVVAAITTLVTALITLAAAYFTPPGVGETVIVDEAGKVQTGRIAPPQP